ncbi:MAG: hypothetical protein FWH10_00425 [Oscillospiraceae bacterium]|nr:hypothetical protein [Oscillospiraceae bacterium]
MLKNNDLKIKIVLVFLAFCLALLLSVTLGANAGQASDAAAGSADDPLITLSYLNGVLPGNSSDSGGYATIELRRGQKIRARTNSLEIILRPGYAATVISQRSDVGVGLADLTSGLELLEGDSVPTNHLVLIPRADGRGISIVSENAYIMARGDYEIY